MIRGIRGTCHYEAQPKECRFGEREMHVGSAKLLTSKRQSFVYPSSGLRFVRVFSITHDRE